MFKVVFTVLCLILVARSSSGPYKPTWDSLDTRPLPAWFDESKIGIFIHWGVFSVPSFGSEWFWEYWMNSKNTSSYWKFMEENYKPGFAYADFATQFTAEMFDPDHWADVFAASGAKYVVLTSKHHEGFCNWKTNVSFAWNSVAVGPHRDLVGELAASVRKRTNITFGIYHSLLEWFNPLYVTDKANDWKTQNFAKQKAIPELHELVNTYKPEIIWSDGDWQAPAEYWAAQEFLAWLYNESPVKDTIVVNDRWCEPCRCKHGDYYTCHDRYNPGTLQEHKWENAMTIDKASWGFRRNAELSAYLTRAELLETLAKTISCRGNLLINVGPTHDGRLIPIFEERLRQLGDWLKVNGEAVYKSNPWIYQNDTQTGNVWYTQKKSASSNSGYSVYAFVLQWPADNLLKLGAPQLTDSTRIQMLGWSTPLKFAQSNDTVIVQFPYIPPNKMPCEDAWVLKFDNLKNSWSGMNW